MHITHKHLHWFAWINGIIIVGGTITLVFLAFFQGSHVADFPAEPLRTVESEFNEQGEYVPKKTFYIGEQLSYALEFCKKTPIPAEVYGYYIDTVKIAMPVLKINSPVGCHRTISTTFKIPKILPSGKYHFEVELIYQVNPIRQVRIKYRTEEFQIINNDLNSNKKI